MSKVLIIGAGLSGLSTAYALRNSSFDVEILEARPRLGGRIFTKKSEKSNLELGATWFGPQHTSLFALIKELNIPYKVQENGREALYDFRPKGKLERFQIPDQGSSTFKFTNGTSSLIDAIYEKISAKIRFNEVVKSIHFDQNFKVTTEQHHFEADYLIISIPPQLISDTIQFEPKLPEDLKNLLLNTHTWMSDSIKFSAAFTSDLWKANQFIGTLMSPQQIIQEMYDHSDVENSQNALVGFLNSSNTILNEEQRKDGVLKYLETVFPKNTSQIVDYADVDWRKEPFTISKQAQALVPHQNNGNATLREGLFNNKLFFSASETSAQTPGYMDGAIHRGLQVGQLLLNLIA